MWILDQVLNKDYFIFYNIKWMYFYSVFYMFSWDAERLRQNYLIILVPRKLHQVPVRFFCNLPSISCSRNWGQSAQGQSRRECSSSAIGHRIVSILSLWKAVLSHLSTDIRWALWDMHLMLSTWLDTRQVSIHHVNKGTILNISILLFMKLQVIPGVGLLSDLNCLSVEICLAYLKLRAS